MGAAFDLRFARPQSNPIIISVSMAAAGPKGKDRNVHGLRFVDFPRIERKTSIMTAVTNYVIAAEGSFSAASREVDR